MIFYVRSARTEEKEEKRNLFVVAGDLFDKFWLFDFSEPLKNEFLAVNQFTIVEDENHRPRLPAYCEKPGCCAQGPDFQP